MIKNIDHKNVIHYGEDALVIKVENSEFEKAVCLKILNEEFPPQQLLKSFESEFNFSRFTESPFVRKAIKKTAVENHAAIVYEYIDGITLKAAIQQQNISFVQKLALASQITAAIADIHKQNIIHQNLHPENILTTKGFEKVYVIDFDKALRNSIIQGESNAVSFTLKGLKYIAPEQTGRIHQTVDHRADMYSLGVILYELFTNKLPFESKDPSELLYAHLAKEPVAPHDAAPALSPVISNIILKLLMKDAGARYQSASGLMYDLDLCIKYQQSYGYILPFTIGENDFSGKLFFQQKLYGRERETGKMTTLFHQSTTGKKKTLFISGYSGNGKSSLLTELQRPVIEKKGFFLQGKFEQFANDMPFHAFVQAFTSLINFILTDEGHSLNQWKNRITEAIGTSGKVLTNLIPDLQKLIGPQPELIQLKGTEDQNRFYYIINRFLETVCTAQHPLVLCIDDLQWADASSLHLFNLIAENKNLHYLFLVGTYRTDENKNQQAIQALILSIQKNNIDVEEIILNNLPENEVALLVADALNTRQKDSKELAELVYLKTKGNAFYVNQFLKSVYEEGLLQFNFDTITWQWNKHKILQTNASENVIDFITSQVQKLPAETLSIFELAACTGTNFQVTILSAISGYAAAIIEKNLYHPLAEGMLQVNSDGFKFAHNRIQQVFYKLIPNEKKKEIHFKVAAFLTDHYTEEEKEQNLFELVNHWNSAEDLIQQEDILKKVVQLNLRAGRKAKLNSAHNQSFKYYRFAIKNLNKNSWQQQYHFTLSVYNEAADVAYLSGAFNELESLSVEVIQNSKNILHTTRIYEILIQKLIAENRLIDALYLGIDILKQLGIRLPKHPGKVHILATLLKTKWIVSKRSIDEIQQLPALSNAKIIAAMRLLSEITSASYFALPNLMPILLCKILELTVKHGLSTLSPFGFMGWGFIQSVYFGKIEVGIRYGKLALQLVQQLKANELQASTAMSFNVFLIHWKKHLPETIAHLESAFKAGLEIGDYEFTSYLAHNIVYHSFYSGLPLEPLQKKTEYLHGQIEKFRQELTVKRLQVYGQSIYNLIHPTSEPYFLAGDIFNELKTVIANKPENSGYFQNLYLQKMVLAIIFNNSEAAYEYAILGEPFNYVVKGSVLFSHFYFYQSLAIIGFYRDKKENTSLQKVRKNLSLLKKYEVYCDKTYRQKRMLVEAEFNDVDNKGERARTLYDEAIKAALASGLLQDIALCYEKTGQFYLRSGNSELASFYLNKAFQNYQKWGAEGKAKQMLSYYTELKQVVVQPNGHSTNNGKLDNVVNTDLTSVLKATTALSEELVLQNLLKKLMQIIMENAGAQQGFFIMNKNGERIIEAKGTTDTEAGITLPSVPVANSSQLAESIVNYVEVTQEQVILENAAVSVLFANDEFIKKHQPKSILCAPFINHGKLQGILYLSNDLIYGAFTKDRLQLLHLLTGQIAVSIENALFYDSLEQRVKDRTNDLELEKKKSDDLLLNILPEEVATELKQTGYAQARRFENVTVMFTDFKNFTQHSEKLKPEQLVAELDICFRKFDEITSKYGLEKIKTIGDAYLCVGGLPHPNPPENVVMAALDICHFMESLKEQRSDTDMPGFDIRIGIHSGPVVAGIVGNKKFAYDIWGDTVNTAARMEQCSEPNKINISYATYQLIENKFICQSRGKINAKNKGLIDMYFVSELAKLQTTGTPLFK